MTGRRRLSRRTHVGGGALCQQRPAVNGSFDIRHGHRTAFRVHVNVVLARYTNGELRGNHTSLLAAGVFGRNLDAAIGWPCRDDDISAIAIADRGVDADRRHVSTDNLHRAAGVKPDIERPAYDREDRQPYSMPLRLESGTIAGGTPKTLPVRGFMQAGARRQYDVASDGSRFLMMFR